MSNLSTALPFIENYSPRVRERVSIEARYAPYVAIQAADAASMAREEGLALPPDMDFGQVFGLSMEEKGVLGRVRPETVGQARRVEGVTPNAALLLVAWLRRRRRGVGFDQVDQGEEMRAGL